MAELIRRLHELARPENRRKDIYGSEDASDSQDVDEDVLSQLLSDTYAESSDSRGEVFETGRETAARRLIESVYAFEGQKVKEVPVRGLKVPITVFEQFLQSRQKQLTELFRDVDTDHDARISYDDMVRYLDRSGVAYDPAKISAVLHHLDSDGDGLVYSEEFVRRLALVPVSGFPKKSLFVDAYDFFVDDLELSGDSDVLLAGESGHGFGYFWAGGFAGVISRTSTAPFDRIKVFLIAQSSGHPLTTWEVIQILWRQQKFRAFFVGNGLNILKVFPESAMKFGGFETAKNIFSTIEGVEDSADLSRLATFVAGGIGGMISQLCVYPIDTLKFRVQCETAARGGRSRGVILKTIREMIATGGIRTFYRGLYVGVLGIFPFAALDLGIFSALKKGYLAREARRLNIDPSEVQLGNMFVLSMGAISGSVGATAVYPVNLVRTRIQTQGTKGHPFHYKGFIDCSRQTYAREGWRGFFRGLGPNLAKVAPSVSISYLVYEKTKKFMGLQ